MQMYLSSGKSGFRLYFSLDGSYLVNPNKNSNGEPSPKVVFKLVKVIGGSSRVSGKQPKSSPYRRIF